jgi:FkbM family methyltransferase
VARRFRDGKHRKIFLDCGFHLGQGLRHFLRHGIIDTSWEIHAFEANPACQLSRRIESFRLNIIPHACAVWISDGSVAFRQENHQLSDSGSPNDGASAVDGWGSSVAAVGAQHPGYETEVTVPCIDFSRFVKELPSPAKIICKLNVEGSEFAILRRMLCDGTIDRISKLYVEFHQGMVLTESDRSVNDLVRQIKSRGVIVDTSEIYEIPYSLD